MKNNTKATAPAQSGQHTPGPWMIMLAYEARDKRPPYNVWNIIGNTSDDERKHSTVATTITDDADARLVAAAPALLAALEHAVERLEASQPVIGSATWEVIKEARDAIAKTEGRPRKPQHSMDDPSESEVE